MKNCSQRLSRISRGAGRTRCRARMRSTRFCSGAVRRSGAPPALTNLDAQIMDSGARPESIGAHAVEFSKTVAPLGGGASSARAHSGSFPSGHSSVARPANPVQGGGGRPAAARNPSTRGRDDRATTRPGSGRRHDPDRTTTRPGRGPRAGADGRRSRSGRAAATSRAPAVRRSAARSRTARRATRAGANGRCRRR